MPPNEYILTCTYCGYIWNLQTYSSVKSNKYPCPQCKDKKTKAKKKETKDVFGYNYNKEEKDEDDFDFNPFED